MPPELLKVALGLMLVLAIIEPAAAHSWYVAPMIDISCCGGFDCEETSDHDVREVRGGFTISRPASSSPHPASSSPRLAVPSVRVSRMEKEPIARRPDLGPSGPITALSRREDILWLTKSSVTTKYWSTELLQSKILTGWIFAPFFIHPGRPQQRRESRPAASRSAPHTKDWRRCTSPMRSRPQTGGGRAQGSRGAGPARSCPAGGTE